ncbi:MAG TPA: ATP-dependent DNA helicase [Acetobacteraceae bacterium]|nr:ATP-dependent DNA helicase [Acetobacteraceae bacterium]
MPPSSPSRIALPDAPSLVAGHGRAAILTADGELLTCPADEAAAAIRAMDAPVLVHAPATLRRLGLRAMPCLDVLELFAFVLPARTVAPTPRGLALALDLDATGAGLEAEVTLLPDLVEVLLRRLAAGRMLALNRDAAALAARMGQAGWGWAPFVMAALGRSDAAASVDPLLVWKRLPEWEETAPLPAPSSLPVPEVDARRRLAAMLGPAAEQRQGQSDYAGAAATAFAPREVRGDPHLVLAEAGTGTGKTLAYIAPASLWAERNRGTVWISTFTKHLQRQIDAELARLFPDPAERRRRVVVRKGRENYLCLLNYEETLRPVTGGVGRGRTLGGSLLPASLVPLGLIARWALATSDGDIQGGDLPGWFSELFGAATVLGLADRRGECIHAACAHWKRCFVEHTIRRARTAQLVVANHALVMAQAAWGGLDDASVPTRYVFDEGHHVFDAADSAFSAELSGSETAELRRWLLGAEGGRSRARGLRRRLDELVAERPALQAPLDAALQAARALPSPGWWSRLGDDDPELDAILEKLSGADALHADHANPTESFLRLLRRQVLARVVGDGDPGSRASWGAQECDLFPPVTGLVQAAEHLARALGRIVQPLETLRTRLAARLEDEAEEMDAATRVRIEATCRSLGRRAIDPLTAWRGMLRAVAEAPGEPGQRPQHVMFVRLDRRGMEDRDVGLHRHWLDPTVPFALSLAAPAHGLLVTSATLRDSGEADAEISWEAAEARVGAPHLPSPAIRVAVASPFDYAAQTRTFIVTDVAAGDIGALAAAYRALFVAAGGGGLGLFTAIRRLQAVHARIAPELEAAGIPLYAQHVDAMDNATLVDIFRTEEESCLLGTDAMRDGVDVPGRALRLVVFEKVPWARPDILHRERRVHLSGGDLKGYDDRIARLRLRQAFGRLIRRATDRGVFVLLDRQTPSRLLSAFPAGVEVRRVGLAQAVAEVRGFLGDSAG